MNNIIGIIPARYASQRLNAKPLAVINGLPMVVLVWNNVSKSKYLNQTIITTDDERIADVCKQFNCPFVMTSPEINSGTERVFEAYKSLNSKYDIVVNIQGDEPLLQANDVDNLLENFIKTDYEVGTLITKINASEDVFNPNNVKVVMDRNNCAMYFSRSAIPFIRNSEQKNWNQKTNFWKHIGIYAYRIDALKKFIASPQSHIENCESLEQIRLLELGHKYFCIETNTKLISVDTQADLDLVRNINSSIN